ncbi:signal transduction histidine kinase [Nitrosococcus oceani ATCC 19707]|uniref:histidine kinase n=2 Tax=Nitrosococcus oceani TaxID=1229 RepID=Q3JD60_NITOC|nr:ATP-binding protein [Nitrosococcus oceani]ABA57236.1 signal transduction histidine kinase [Nitrosococcus oceani ATCC 19707]EDZ66581.1 ATPase, histidine kinase-, DNA gyrase B-, and HSP90-like domain protein [Nitrosococcus oceani AFC27]KFI20370.1 ATPase [Nitrosococcus oceani C-27]
MNWQKAIKDKRIIEIDGQDIAEGPLPPWRPLAVFCLYRLLIVSLLLVAVITGAGPGFLGESHPNLFLITSLVYAAAAIALGVATIARMGGFCFQVWFQLTLDIGAITLLMHASGGVLSGLGMLLVVVIAAGGILTVGRTASAFAALATLAVLLEQSHALVFRDFDTVHYTQAGLLGATLFATALLAQVLTARIRESEALAAQRSLDLANISQLNGYIIQHLQSGVLVIDREDTLRLINQAGRALLGLKPGGEKKSLDRIAPCLAKQLNCWREGLRSHQPEAFRSRWGQSEILSKFISLGPRSGTLIFLEDASASARQAQQLKLASLGRLTASIAHEIRNPLGAISHASQLLRESSTLSQSEQRLLEIILNHCTGVNGIVKNVLQLSRRQQHSRLKVLALKPWLLDFLDEFCRTQGIDRTEVALQIRSGTVQVHMDPSQFHQILWNLCDNARRHSRSLGRIPCFQISVESAVDMGQVFLEVLDRGSGIPNDIADKIFEPFFTTQGTGTGLGLYLARELSECNGASLEYRPAPGGGSCFRLCFAPLGMMGANVA